MAAISINAMADRWPASRVRRLFPMLEDRARALERARVQLKAAQG